MKSNTPMARAFDPSQESDALDDHGFSSGVGFGGSDDDFADLMDTKDEAETQWATAQSLASMLSGARSLTPLLEALTFSPGLNATEDELTAALNKMLESSNTITKHAAGSLGIESSSEFDWARSMLSQVAVAGVAQQWKNAHHADPNAWLGIIDNLIAAGVTESRRPYPDVHDQIAHQVSQFAALSRLGSEIRQFSFYYDKSQLLEQLSRFLDAEVGKASKYVLEGVNATNSDRLMVEQGMLKHASSLLAETYRSVAEKTYIDVHHLPRDQQNEYIQSGVMQERVREVRDEFNSLFHTLARSSRQRARAHVSTAPDARRSAPTMS